MPAPKNTASGLVYSTALGRTCPACEHAIEHCKCSTTEATQSGDGIVRLQRQTKGRKGKGVTLITGVSLEPTALIELSKQLKRKCGSGGTIKNGVIEIQGDHRAVLMLELQKLGWTVKFAGG